LKLVQVEELGAVSKIKFSVIDTGIGIKDYNQKKIFQSFIQADSTTTRKYGGTGLGLAISSQLLKLKNSELQLSSDYGVGSEFFFTVSYEKIAHRKNGSELKNSFILDESAYAANALINFKVLIVEDNKINMLLAKTLVKKIIKNCDLTEANNGHDAVVLAEKKMPDLILMDIQMPIQNGYDATLEIKRNEKTKHIPVIALTAGVLNGEKEKCFEYGMSDYVTKPIVQSELQKVLLKWLNVKIEY
jgi:CheY-like chemotaxis protein